MLNGIEGRSLKIIGQLGIIADEICAFSPGLVKDVQENFNACYPSLCIVLDLV